MPGPDSVELKPAADDGIRAIHLGLGLWAAVGGVLFIQRDSLADRDAQWWLLTCGAGLIIGLVEWGIFARHAARVRAEADAADPT